MMNRASMTHGFHSPEKRGTHQNRVFLGADKIPFDRSSRSDLNCLLGIQKPPIEGQRLE
jgi:hypothetical protein